MIKKIGKVTSVVLSLGMTVALLAPVSVSAATSGVIDSKLSQSQTDHLLQVNGNGITQTLKNLDLASTNLLDPYMTVTKEGLLHLDEAGRNVVSAELFNTTANGVSIINTAIKEGSVVLDTVNKRVVPKQVTVQQPSLKTPSMSPNAYSNTYWWGVAITMTEDETKTLAYSLQQVKETYTAATVVAGAIGGIMGPNPIPWAAAAASAIVACGAAVVSNSLTFYNNPNGVTLNIHWLPAPYYTVNKN
ncbi:hypothetical protein LJK88_29640 [Paenibacillus sp. P26]|nr:hypothetical protein LJK88_29640 [Paenibacillus sp. P26]